MEDKFVKEQSITKGCAEGVHEFAVDSAEVKEVNGKLSIVTKCVFCGFELVNASDAIGVMMEDYSKTSQPLPSPEPGEPTWAPTIKDRYNREKPEDSFWDGIKKGKV